MLTLGLKVKRYNYIGILLVIIAASFILHPSTTPPSC